MVRADAYCPSCDSLCCDIAPAWCAVCEGWRHGIEGFCSARFWTSANRFASSRCCARLGERLEPGLDVEVALDVGLLDLGWSRVERFTGRVLAVSGPVPPFALSRPLHVVVVGRDDQDLSVSAGKVRPATSRMRVEDAMRAFFAALAA